MNEDTKKTPLGKLYSLGYTGRTPAQIAEIAKGTNSIIVDVRLAARSRVNTWNKTYLSTALAQHGVRYEHFPDLGNLNYKTGGIALKNQKAGAASLLGLLSVSNCVILCMCPCVDDCHRKYVADAMAQKYGVDVEHIPHPTTGRKKTADKAQSVLFP